VSIAENHDNALSESEQRALDALEERLGRGTSVKWDRPKTVRGFLARPIETATVKDFDDPSKTVEKRVATLRTAEGLQAIWKGPTGLKELFEIEGSGMPVVVSYVDDSVSQEGRPYKKFDVVVGEAPKPSTDETEGGDDDIPF
jgi:hypothetical protein